MIETWQHRGLTVGFTNGCFDILHRGHVTLLQAARDALRPAGGGAEH
jgi:D-beta-D-heptose 7-phosphate kinase/D-beta-D-heptose 1-phosphate adenosyltransferase